MASISDDPGGRKRVQFIAGDGKRKTIRLGKASMKQAEAVKVKVERLVAASITGHAPDDETSRWVAGLDRAMNAKLVAVGLVKPQARADTGLGVFLKEFFAALSVKPGTAIAYGHVRRCLTEFFGEGKPLREISPLDGDKFRQWLKDHEQLSEATISRRIVTARQMFKQACKWKLIAESPFAEVKAGSQKNKQRQFFVTREMATAVLDACPDVEWRLLFALSRYGGLRCPSEHLALKWADIDWDKERMRVYSSKTEHHEGGESRLVPLFPELRRYLLEAFELAAEGATYVIARRRQSNPNLRTQLKRIIRRAGLEPWPRLFQNLRASCETELSQRHAIHLVCAWIGHTEKVARDHYLQVRDEDFIRAAQKEAQQPAEPARTGQQTQTRTTPQGPELPSVAASCGLVQEDRMGAVGFEPTKA